MSSKEPEKVKIIKIKEFHCEDMCLETILYFTPLNYKKEASLKIKYLKVPGKKSNIAMIISGTSHNLFKGLLRNVKFLIQRNGICYLEDYGNKK